ncbi:MAG TPA: POTRA domain-containing protein [Edaphobacter sp.]|nr:POTRA domain-containing protein [Edaphobacter sp.]
MFSRVLLQTATLLCLTSAAFAQYTIKKIVFDGTTPYAQADLEAASGLKSGDHLTQDTMQQAAQRLIDTGAFGDLQVTLDGPIKAVSVVFKVKPADPERMLAVGFENFIWWQPEELSAEVHRRVPLFNGSLPEAGSLQQAVQDALQQMLTDKQVAAKLSAKIYDAAPGSPTRSIEYRIESPDIQLHSLKLEGVSADHTAEIAKITSSLAGSRYTESLGGSSITGRILAVYRNSGFLDASLDNLNRAISTPAPGRVDVDLTATIKPGEPYHVAQIDWAGAPFFTSKDFSEANKLHSGDLASQQALRASLAIIDTAYRRQGYMDVSVDATPQFDTTAHRVTYTVGVISGEQYHLREVQTAGLAPESRATFDAAWKLHPGDLYDATYVETFLKANIAQPYLQPYSVTYRIVRDPDTHLVTVIFVFAHHSR